MEQIQGADRSKWIVHSNHNIKCFTQGDVERITANYSTILGRGAFGEVYKGVLEDKSEVAVKRFLRNLRENFDQELNVHHEINHKNVVRLIGYCVDENALMMVTEYVVNGNLCDILHHDNIPITLDIRLRIAAECAEALAYMHSYMYTQVIHGDIKPANILLDGGLNVKLSDFGISRLVSTDETLFTENVMGSIGYMDPLFAWDGRVTAKSDVYSFGTVLVELITRKKVTALGGEVGSIHEFTNALTGGTRRTREMFDSEILSNNKMKTLEGVAKLAGECMQLERDKRPNMTHVVERLRMLRKVLHQDQRQQPVDLFSWLRRKKPASADVVTFPVKTLSSDLLSPHFTYAEMKAATNNFDQSLLVGEGSKFGRVYRGIVDGTTTKVVIRRCEDLSMRRRRDFHNQIEMLSKLRHDHLVPLMGYCHEKDEMILVYDYMPGGSLQEHLYRTQKPKLTWKQRIEICIGAARGLCYLHKLQIIHGAVKTTNILLDEEWVAKITDLDPAKASSEVETTMLGSCAGLAPEYILSGRFTKKSDVYSFGVVLLEVLCARPILDRRVPQEQANLVDWALRCKKKGNLEQIVDPYLKGRISRQCLNKYGEAAKKCLADRDINRPSMGDVISYLEDALELQSLSEAN